MCIQSPLYYIIFTNCSLFHVAFSDGVFAIVATLIVLDLT